MKVVILTGGIGSGKSTVGSLLKELGAEVIDSDRLGREALNPGSAGFNETLEAFGRDLLTVDGTIDRTKLSRIVFNDRISLLTLNRIIHPKVDSMIEARLRELEKRDTRAVFIEMAILAEAPFMQRADGVWLVQAARDIVLERLKNRGIDQKDALSRMANQPSVEDQIKGKITIIVNNGNKAELKEKIKKLWDEL